MTHKQIVENLRGVFPPLITPMNRRGGLDEGAFRANLRRYAASGLSGVVVAGSTGEAPFLTEAERLRLIEIARIAIKPPKLLIAGTGLEGTGSTIKLSREAIARGADAVLLLPPAYYKAAMNPETLSIHFRAVAYALRRPVLIYSIPQFTGYAMDAGMLGKLSRHPNIAGLKESSGNLEFVRAILAKARPGFKLMIGSGLIFPQALGESAAGGILGQSNFAPQLCVAIYDAFSGGDMKTAEELRQRLLILVENITGPYGIPGIKAALDLLGYRGGNPRPPFMPVSAQVKKKIAAALRRAGVEG